MQDMFMYSEMQCALQYNHTTVICNSFRSEFMKHLCIIKTVFKSLELPDMRICMAGGLPHAEEHDNLIRYIGTCGLFICPLVSRSFVAYAASTKFPYWKHVVYPKPPRLYRINEWVNCNFTTAGPFLEIH